MNRVTTEQLGPAHNDSDRLRTAHNILQKDSSALTSVDVVYKVIGIPCVAYVGVDHVYTGGARHCGSG